MRWLLVTSFSDGAVTQYTLNPHTGLDLRSSIAHSSLIALRPVCLPSGSSSRLPAFVQGTQICAAQARYGLDTMSVDTILPKYGRVLSCVPNASQRL